MQKITAQLPKLISVLLLTASYFLLAAPINAVCPVCTVAVGGGVLLSHYLGIDDLLIGIWTGGLILSLGLWSASYIKRTFIKGQAWLLTAILWVTTVLGLKKAGFIGNPTCKIQGYDKLLTGIIAGSLVFVLAYGIDFGLRKLNKSQPGKAFFPYQRVVIPVALLIIATLFGAKVCQIIL
jgi:hypothetical protein